MITALVYTNVTTNPLILEEFFTLILFPGAISTCWKCSMHSFIPPGSLMSQPHTHSPLGSSKENSPRIPWNRKKFHVEVIYSSEYFTEKWLHLLVMPLNLITFQN